MTKLLETKIVANNLFGLSSNETTAFFLLDLDSAALSKSILESEKKATSAPEIKADIKSNKKSKAMLRTFDKTSADKRIVKNVGSGSNLNTI